MASSATRSGTQSRLSVLRSVFLATPGKGRGSSPALARLTGRRWVTTQPAMEPSTGTLTGRALSATGPVAMAKRGEGPPAATGQGGGVVGGFARIPPGPGVRRDGVGRGTERSELCAVNPVPRRIHVPGPD